MALNVLVWKNVLANRPTVQSESESKSKAESGGYRSYWIQLRLTAPHCHYSKHTLSLKPMWRMCNHADRTFPTSHFTNLELGGCVSVVSQSVFWHLTSRTLNRSTNTTYSALGIYIGRKICRVFSETAAFGRFTAWNRSDANSLAYLLPVHRGGIGSYCAAIVIVTQFLPTTAVSDSDTTRRLWW